MPAIRSTTSVAIAIALCSPICKSQGAVETRQVLKTFFLTGSFPTQDEFSTTSANGSPDPANQPDLLFTRGAGGHHWIEGLDPFGFGVAAIISDGADHVMPLSVGQQVGPSSAQFASILDSFANRIDDRYLLGLRFARPDGFHYGVLDVSTDSPIDGWPDYYAFTIHGWAFETQPNTPIPAQFVPAPGAASLLAAGALAMSTRRRRR